MMDKNTPDETISSFCPNCLHERPLRVIQSSRGKYQYSDKQEYLDTPHNLLNENDVGSLNGSIDLPTYLVFMDPERCWLGVLFLECITCKAEVVEERIYFFIQDGDLFRAEVEGDPVMPILSDEEENLGLDPFDNLVNQEILELTDKILEEEQCVVLNRRVVEPIEVLTTFKVLRPEVGGWDKYLPEPIFYRTDETPDGYGHFDVDMEYLGEFFLRFTGMLKETKRSLLSGSDVLTVIGLRTLVELLCNFTGEDTVKGTTDKTFDRFSAIKELGILSPRQIKFMRDLYAAGNRAAHDRQITTRRDKLLSHTIEIEKIAELIWSRVTDENLETVIVDIPKRMKWGKEDLILLNKSKETNNKIKQQSGEGLNSNNIVRPKLWDK